MFETNQQFGVPMQIKLIFVNKSNFLIQKQPNSTIFWQTPISALTLKSAFYPLCVYFGCCHK